MSAAAAASDAPGAAPERDEVPGQFWRDYIRQTAPVFQRPTVEQLETFIALTFAALTAERGTWTNVWSSSSTRSTPTCLSSDPGTVRAADAIERAVAGSLAPTEVA